MKDIKFKFKLHDTVFTIFDSKLRKTKIIDIRVTGSSETEFEPEYHTLIYKKGLGMHYNISQWIKQDVLFADLDSLIEYVITNVEDNTEKYKDYFAIPEQQPPIV